MPKVNNAHTLKTDTTVIHCGHTKDGKVWGRGSILAFTICPHKRVKKQK